MPTSRCFLPRQFLPPASRSPSRLFPLSLALSLLLLLFLPRISINNNNNNAHYYRTEWRSLTEPSRKTTRSSSHRHRYRVQPSIERHALSLSLSSSLVSRNLRRLVRPFLSASQLACQSVSQSLSSSRLRAARKNTLREVVRATGPPRVRPPPCASREVYPSFSLAFPARCVDPTVADYRAAASAPSGFQLRGGSPTRQLGPSHLKKSRRKR